MHAYVTVRAPGGDAYELVHGDVIGRLQTAALHVDDGRISEAHAMVSLRDGALRLLPLRGAFAVDGRPQSELVLRAGQRVELAPGVALEVLEVVLPDAVLGIEGPGLARRMVPSVCSILPGARLVAGWDASAETHLWSTGGAWTLRHGGRTVSVAPGDTHGPLRFVAISLENAGQHDTRQGAVHSPLHVVANYDTVHVHRGGTVVVTLSGVLARIVSELVALGGPVAWTVLAAEIWPDADPVVARVRLDANLTRIRRKLRAASVRDDLVRTDGAGQVELLLNAHDTLVDRT